ncbi:MAG: SpoIIE family protein phosphatase [Chitinivibrionales bacterium]|nr:SpoIIE family protein phosphatase [Chitinivibrionales bacterium]MBD3396271.1 SpoIIE family protein phosphatase [Chitinivibrionales bacterium]
MATLDTVQTFVDGLLTPACIVGRDLQLLYTNYEFLDMAKISQRDIRRGMRCSQCLKAAVFTDGNALVTGALDKKETVKLREVKAENARGEYLSLGVSCIPLPGASSEQDVAVMVFSDLTLEENVQEKYKDLYEREREEREKLEQFNRRLNELVDERSRELGETHRKLKTAYSELSQELEMAKNVQTALLPREFPSMMNIEFSHAYVPTGKVGGDLFDISVTPEGKLAVLIFDVSGHGVPASLIGAMAKMLFARYLDRLTSPARIFSEVNKYICNSIKTDHYLTAFLGLIDPEDNTMIYAKAAHPAPIVYHEKTGTIEMLQGKGLFIGHSALASIATYQDAEARFDDGDRVLFYTDGITEATNPGEQMFGTERLVELVRKHHALRVEDSLAGMLRDHTAYTKGTPLRDDFTLLCLQFGSSKALLVDSGFSHGDKPNVLMFNTYEEIEKVCAVILRDIDRNGFSEQEIWSAKLCIHEIFINAVTHGNGNDRSKRVTVFYKVDADTFTVSVLDEGDGFDHQSLPDPKEEANLLKDGGRGLYFVRAYMDAVRFNERGNRITVVKNHREAE